MQYHPYHPDPDPELETHLHTTFCFSKLSHMTLEWMDRNNSANTEIISPGQSAPNFLDPKTLALPKMHFIPELFRKRTFPHPNIVFFCELQHTM